MHRMLRSSLALTAALACLDASAAARRNCVTSLEAQPRPMPSNTAAPEAQPAAPATDATPKKPCPVAVGYSPPLPASRDALVETAPSSTGRARA
jgi:hypothetical protein